MIKLGDKWGSRYDFFDILRHYVALKIKDGITLKNWYECGEFIRDPKMYLVNGFIPSRTSVIYDIGAQYADYAIYWAIKYGCRIYAFEGLPWNYVKAVNNAVCNLGLMNHWDIFSDIHIYNVMVGNGAAIGYNSNGGMAFFDSNPRNLTQSVALDSFAFDSGILLPDIIKIDVEGFEYQVLLGSLKLIKTKMPRIIVETHSLELRSKVHDLLTSLGYELRHIGRTVQGKQAWMDQITNLFYSP